MWFAMQGSMPLPLDISLLPFRWLPTEQLISGLALADNYLHNVHVWDNKMQNTPPLLLPSTDTSLGGRSAAG